MYQQGIDNKLARILPEGVSINIVPAGIAVRTSAYLIDFLIRAVVLIVSGILLSFLGKAGEGIFLVIYFVVTWGYYIFFELKYGQTPGKKRYNLKVVQDNGLPIQLSHAVLRNLLRSADAFPVAYILGVLTMVFGKQFKRIGDWGAGTIVIYQQPSATVKLPNTDVALPSPVALSTEEQQAIIAFAERSDELSTARQNELANLLVEPLAIEGEAANERLKKIAQHYVGQEI